MADGRSTMSRSNQRGLSRLHDRSRGSDQRLRRAPSGRCPGCRSPSEGERRSPARPRARPQRSPLSAPGPSRKTLREGFERAYWERFRIELPEIHAKLVNVNTSVIGERPPLDLARLIDPAGRKSTLAEAETGLSELGDVAEARAAVEVQRGEVDLARTSMLSWRSF